MRIIVPVSLILNFILAGCLFHLWMAGHQTTARSSSSFQRQSLPAVSKLARQPLETSKRDATCHDFQWSQLESTNSYRVYVANLRAAGCPEATIEDIVRGDVARAFAFKRRELRLSAAGKGPWSSSREAALVSALLTPFDSLANAGSEFKRDTTSNASAPSNESKASVIDHGNGLLTASTHHSVAQTARPADVPTTMTANADSSVSMVASAQKFSRQRAVSAVTDAPTYPLVLQNVNLNALGFTAGQKAVVQQLKQQFVKDIGGPNQNPNDPAYLKRWQQAQPQSDLMFKAMMGITAWENYQLAAADKGTKVKNPYASP